MKNQFDIWGVKAIVFFKTDEDLESLAAKLSSALRLPDFNFDTDQDPPHEKFGSCESLGSEIWLNKLPEEDVFSFVLKMESSGIPEAVLSDQMHDVSPWLGKYISELTDLNVFIKCDENILIEFVNGVIRKYQNSIMEKLIRKINFRGTIDKLELNKVQDTIGFELDQDYYLFLEKNNGGTCENCAVWVEGLTQYISLDGLFGNNLPVETSNLLFWIKEYGDEIPPESILIADDPGGGLFLLVKNAGVYYWDHSWFFEQSSEEENIYFVASSFTEFMNKLKPLE